ncbi:MAG: hypothetical protein RJA07_1219 [Bacteroidota bacterium]|jgi:hypothetical protein
MNANNAILVFHSLLRWVILLLAAAALYRSYIGWRNKKEYNKQDNLTSLFFMIAVDIQLLMGLIMYFVTSDMVRAFRANMATAMHESSQRFWVVEHFFGMLVGIAFIHIGRIASKKATTDEAKHKKQFIFFLIGLIIILATIPWPGTPAGRGLLPNF